MHYREVSSYSKSHWRAQWLPVGCKSFACIAQGIPLFGFVPVKKKVTECLADAGIYQTSAGRAVLLCVMGGRFSEGVNFSDSLSRSIIIVGMPYPNVQDSVFLLQKAHFATLMPRKTKELATSPLLGPLNTPERLDFGMLQCMTTFNQTVGRGIRHRGDFASFILVDERFEDARVRQLMSTWFLRSIEGFPLDKQGLNALKVRLEAFYEVQPCVATTTA